MRGCRCVRRSRGAWMSSPRVRRGGCVTWPRTAWQASPRWMLRTDVVKIEVRRVMDAQVACSVDGFDLALRDPQARQLWRLFEHGGFTPMSRSTKLPASREDCSQGVMRGWTTCTDP